MRRTASGLGMIGAFAGLGLRFMIPGVGTSNPSPTASRTWMAKLIHRTWSGVRGMPLATSKMPARTKRAMKAISAAIWKRTYFIRLS